jgi:hypothetical protein
MENFSHRDVPFRRVEAHATMAEGKCVVRDAVLETTQGTVEVAQVNIVPEQGFFEIINARGSVHPWPLLRCVNRNLENAITPYKFTQPPQVNFNGAFYTRDPSKSYYSVVFSSDAPLSVAADGRSYAVLRVKGTVQAKNNVVTVAAVGRGAAGISYPPVRCSQPSDVSFKGDFGVGSQRNINKWTLDIQAPAGLTAEIAGKALPVQNVVATVFKNGPEMAIGSTGTLTNGALEVGLTWDDLRTKQMKGDILLTKTNFGQLMRIYTPDTKAAGIFTGTFSFSSLGTNKSINGTGTARIENTDIFSVPLLGPLSGLLNAVLPLNKLTYSTAREGTANFRVRNGILESENFLAKTGLFELRLNGLVNLLEDRVGLTARVNFQGVAGVATFLVSKIFEYEAQGTLKDPGWKPKHLPSLPKIPFLSQ